MNEQIQVLSPWVGVGENADFTMLQQISRDYPALIRVSDFTRTPVDNLPPTPNNLVCRVAGPTAVIDALEVDANYTVLEGTRGEYLG